MSAHISKRFVMLAYVALLAVAACTKPAPGRPGVNALPAPWPTASVAAANDAPRILAVHFSSLSVNVGDMWTGKIATTTNVASVEVRTESFTINVPRKSFGQFAFDVHILDLPPFLQRDYTLRVIARNANGQRDEENFPLTFGGVASSP